jgi:uncharacterized protein (TIGR02147 family)
MSSQYVDLMIAEYIQRKNHNSRYSERAFAQAVGLSPGFLKLLFQGKKQLGLPRAKEIAGRLNWNQSKKIEFLKSVQATSSAKSKILSGKFILSDKDFFEISDWFHFAIIEYIKVKNGSVSLGQICSALVLTKTEASFALKHLVRMEMIQEVGHLKYSARTNYEVPSISSEGIRKYHRQMLSRAISAIDAQDMDRRDLRGLTLAFDSRRMEEAKKDIQKFSAMFEKKYGGGINDSVYQLSLALFRLDKEKT